MSESDLPPGVYQQIVDKVNAGRKIEAIKICRTATGWGLKESKEYIDAIALGKTPPSFPTFNRQNSAPAQQQSGELSPEVIQKIVDALQSRNKILAVKIHREATGASLKESKEYVEAMQAGTAPRDSGPITAPRQSSQPAPGTGSTHPHAQSTGGCGSSVFLLTGLIALILWTVL